MLGHNIEGINYHKCLPRSNLFRWVAMCVLSYLSGRLKSNYSKKSMHPHTKDTLHTGPILRIGAPYISPLTLTVPNRTCHHAQCSHLSYPTVTFDQPQPLDPASLTPHLPIYRKPTCLFFSGRLFCCRVLQFCHAIAGPLLAKHQIRLPRPVYVDFLPCISKPEHRSLIWCAGEGREEGDAHCLACRTNDLASLLSRNVVRGVFTDPESE